MTSEQRVDSASRVIGASPEAVFAAFADPTAWEQWLPPTGMTGKVTEFDFRAGGRYQMTLTYLDDAGHGKSSSDTDVTVGAFNEIVPGERLIQDIVFDSDDPAFSGTMQMTWTIQPFNNGVEVTFSATDVPVGISPEDHAAGLQASLENLARYVEDGVTA